MHQCPVCGGGRFEQLVDAERVDAERRERERFIADRLTRPASPDERKDLTDFFHQGRAEICMCAQCGLLVRHEFERPPAETYSEDEYNPGVMERQYPRYVDAFRAKEKPYRSLLPAGARAVEIGSHYGAFLQVAGEWGWRVEGVDVGKDTARFARSKACTVHSGELADCKFPDASFDGVFIWNCFEQIEDPAPLLRECRRIVKPGGLLLARTPNGLFYAMCRRLLADGALTPDAAGFLLEAMGYNNLLAFPYLYGHSGETLRALIERSGWRLEGTLNSELLTLPLPEHPDWIEREERAINNEVLLAANGALSRGGVLTGPWIEVWFRAQ